MYKNYIDILVYLNVDLLKNIYRNIKYLFYLEKTWKKV